MLVHHHLIVRGVIKNPPKNVEYIEQWLKDLTSALGMKVMMGPFVAYCDKENNSGLTGVCIIETSHLALHCWDEENPGMLQLDVYSCAPVDRQVVLDAIQEFLPVCVDYKFLDRSNEFIRML